MTPTLSPDELSRLEEFLALPRIAVVATLGRAGMPQLTPNWYRFADGRLAISTTKERVKYRNLIGDDRLVVCVYSEPLAEEYVTLRGHAEVWDDDSIWPETQAIVERYVAPQRVASRMAVLRTQDRVIISLAPERAVFRT